MKEYKKLKFLELKVVKVKKEEKPFVCPDSGKAICLTCGEKLYHIEKPENQSKENLVNGENLNKIKFPCFCSYIDEDRKRHIGMLNCYYNQYRLYNTEKQSEDNFIDDCTSLGNLIRSYDIHILKGRLIIFEEEE